MRSLIVLLLLSSTASAATIEVPDDVDAHCKMVGCALVPLPVLKELAERLDKCTPVKAPKRERM